MVDLHTDNFADFLASIPVRPPYKPNPKRVMPSKQSKLRYDQSHEQDFKVKYSSAYPEHYFKPKLPDTSKANGLTQAIINFIIWSGYRATRVTSAGRMIGKRYIPGTTRKGAADISATIKGRSVMWEVKVGKDAPSGFQLREQELERKAGGEYFFVHTLDEFFEQYDNFLKTIV